ncbi:MAG: hypothetical protein HY584_01910, partial [Candidatus Omnitrophica bacterium]|nr:hypothetical protein [Candidatus Omnitrophota bacterium]
GTARPSARPALVQAAVPDDRAAVRRLTDWRLKHAGMTLHVRLLRSARNDVNGLKLELID